MNPKCIHILNRFGFGPKLQWLENENHKLLSDQNYLVDWILHSIPAYQNLEQHINQYSSISEYKKTDPWRKNWPTSATLSDYIETLVNLDNPIREKLTLFWNHHVPMSVGIWNFAQNLLIDSYRSTVISNYNDLLKSVSASPCAMKFLNAYHSKKNAPNQNFARELLELFTVGIDNFNQNDVEEVARCFTGRRTVSPDNFNLPYPYKMYIDSSEFDDGIKTIFGKSGKYSGDDAIDILIDQKTTASKLALNFMRFFVSDNPKNEHTEELSKFIFSCKFNTLEIVEFILNSKWFYYPEYINNKVKTPVELWISFQRSLNIVIETSKSHSYALKNFGQTIFHPPNVGGWPWGKSWLTGKNLENRIFLLSAFIEISQDTLPVQKMDLAEKIIYRTTKQNLLGYRYDHLIYFDSSKLEELLQIHNISIANWLISEEKNEFDLKQSITHPSYQYN